MSIDPQLLEEAEAEVAAAADSFAKGLNDVVIGDYPDSMGVV